MYTTPPPPPAVALGQSISYRSVTIEFVGVNTEKYGWPHRLNQEEKTEIQNYVFHTEAKRVAFGSRDVVGIQCRFPATLAATGPRTPSGPRRDHKTVRCVIRVTSFAPTTDAKTYKSWRVNLSHWFEDGSATYVRIYR